jgi:hypothetical protein
LLLKQVVVVPRVGAWRASIAFEHLEFAVDGKHLLYKGSSEMKQAHREGAFVLCSERDIRFL